MRHQYIALQEISIRVSIDSFIEQTGGTKNMATKQELEFVDDFNNAPTNEVVKVMAEIKDGHYRLVQLHNGKLTKQPKMQLIPIDTTHLYYKEFIRDECYSYNIENLIATAVRIVDGEMSYFSESQKKWIVADNGRHVINSTTMHALDWCVEDFENPRLRHLSIGYQLSDYMDQLNFYNTVKYNIEVGDTLTDIQQDVLDLFIKYYHRYVRVFDGEFKTIDDAYNVVQLIENYDVRKMPELKLVVSYNPSDVEQYIQFVKSQHDFLTRIFSHMKDSTFEFKVL